MSTFRTLAAASLLLIPTASPLAADVFVGDIIGDAIRWYSDSGTLKGTLTGNNIDNPFGMTLGPDGLLYVANAGSGHITRHNPTTGEFVDSFIEPINGGLTDPNGVAFGRDGNLYVTDFSSRRVLRYDGQTGDLLGTSTTVAQVDLPLAITTGPDGDLYVNAAVPLGYGVFRIDGGSGTLEGQFATLPSQGWFASFGPDGNLYTPMHVDDLIEKTDGITGASLATWTSVADVIGLDFLPNGDLLASIYNPANPDHGKVLRLDGGTGALLGEFVSAGPTSGGAVLYVPEPATAILLAFTTLVLSRRLPNG